MVSEIQIINEFRPRIEQGITVQKPELVRALSRATGLVECPIFLCLPQQLKIVGLFAAA